MHIVRGIRATAWFVAGLLIPGSQTFAQEDGLVGLVRMVVPTLPGSGIDFAARTIEQPLSGRLGRPVTVVNIAGAATITGSAFVARAVPDGHTLLVTSSALATNPATHRNMPYDALSDFAPIMQMTALPMVLVVHPSLPVKSVRALIDLAKAQPEQISFATPGKGSSPHLYMELLFGMTGIRMLHMSYAGPGPAIREIVTGNAAVMAMSTVVLLPHIRTGRLRAIGVTGTRRTPVAPDLPTLAESGVPGYSAVQWWCMLAPARTPTNIIARLHREITSVLLSKDIKDRLAMEGADVVASSPEHFAAHIRAEMEKWTKVVKAAGIHPE